jgi:putative transposase
VLVITGMTRHQYYYQPKTTTKRGRKASETTVKLVDGIRVKCKNSEVLGLIQERQADIDLASGYHRMTFSLMLMGFIINHKKVYRLMKEQYILLNKPVKKDKQCAKYRIVTPKNPLEVFEMDIKMIWCAQYKRFGYNLTILDTFTRVAIYWEVGYNMKQEQILRAWEIIIEHILQPARCRTSELHIEVRNDNGPQFSATKLRAFFQENGLNHVFTHPYTPQENGHIESFHAILAKTVDNYCFWPLDELEQRLEQFYDNYNNKRIHASVANLPPTLFWRLWKDEKIKRTELSKRKVKFSLLFDYQELSGNKSPSEVPCFSFDDLDGQQMESKKVDELITLKNNHRYKNHP